MGHAMKRTLLLLFFLVALDRSLSADVVRVEVKTRGPFAGGQAFGRSGAYERITGKLIIEVHPEDSANGRVTDLKLAPRNKRGKVEFWTDFDLLAPMDPSRGNGRLRLARRCL